MAELIITGDVEGALAREGNKVCQLQDLVGGRLDGMGGLLRRDEGVREVHGELFRVNLGQLPRSALQAAETMSVRLHGED